MFFSNPELARFLNANFECSWQGLRPVPQVLIDFGDGRKLRRTLMGNITTWFCDADGLALDAVPGLITADEYRGRAQRAVVLHSAVRSVVDKKALIARYHKMWPGLAAKSPEELRRTAKGLGWRPDPGKRRVEQPIKNAVRRALGQLVWHESTLRWPPQLQRRSGDAVARLHRDHVYNLRHRVPKVRSLLAKRAGATVSQMTAAVFKILDVDLEDPYLGLAPYVLGGEPGRYRK